VQGLTSEKYRSRLGGCGGDTDGNKWGYDAGAGSGGNWGCGGGGGEEGEEEEGEGEAVMAPWLLVVSGIGLQMRELRHCMGSGI
jgi:hypothetical protein